MKVVADAMLGRLARWLRALGRDVVHDPAADDAALVVAGPLDLFPNGWRDRLAASL